MAQARHVPAYFDDELGEFNDEYGYNGANSSPTRWTIMATVRTVPGLSVAEGDNDEGIAGINWNVRIMPLKFLGRGGSVRRPTRSRRSITRSTARKLASTFA